MKKFTLISLILALSFISYGQSFKSGLIDMIPDSVVLGPSYADDIYYSFEDGIVATVPRTNWDIGFHTTVWSATIITNGAAGVELYTYPNADTTGWSTVDTAGMLSWTLLYDSEESWEDGAFTRNSSGHPDYGWGKYNPITHDVVGDSVYILKTLNGTYKKIWIVRKNSINNIYYIRHANLDGSNDIVAELSINPYRNMNFIYYAFSSESIITREPDTARWDIVFTKYMAIQPNGTPYPVVGVLSNFDVYANEFHPVAPDFIDYPSMPFDSTKTSVGWEWKTFDMSTFTWTVADSTAFFVHTRKNNVYKLVFTRFAGTSTGVIVFDKEPMSASKVNEINQALELSVYPNPVKDQLTIDFGRVIKGPVTFSIFDITGKQVYTSQMTTDDNMLTIRIPGSSVGDGLHLMKVITSDGIYSSKFMIYKN